MPGITLSKVCVDLPVYGAQGRSFKNRLIAAATGGRLAREAGVTVIRALTDIDLHIESGERIGLWGHNGAGKTTLLRVLAGAYTPTHGQAHIDGDVTSLIDLTLGMDMEASGYENIALRLMIMGRSPKEAKAMAAEIAEFSGLGDFIDLPVRTYSSGMMLRLAFSISTTIKPEILLMDEWLSVGDADFMGQAQQRMERLLDDAHILVIASHSWPLLQRCCTRILVLEHGCIVRDEPVLPFCQMPVEGETAPLHPDTLMVAT